MKNKGINLLVIIGQRMEQSLIKMVCVQNYQVHLKETTQDFDPSNNPDDLDLKHTVTQTIHYVFSNGKQAAPDATASITFNRTAIRDEVTGKITYSTWPSSWK